MRGHKDPRRKENVYLIFGRSQDSCLLNTTCCLCEERREGELWEVSLGKKTSCLKGVKIQYLPVEVLDYMTSGREREGEIVYDQTESLLQLVFFAGGHDLYPSVKIIASWSALFAGCRHYLLSSELEVLVVTVRTTGAAGSARMREERQGREKVALTWTPALTGSCPVS